MATLVAPHVGAAWLAACIFVAISFAVVLLLSALAAATARLAIDTSVRFYWQCTLIFAVLAVSSALLGSAHAAWVAAPGAGFPKF